MAYGHFNQIGSKKLLHEIEKYLSKISNKQTTMTPEEKAKEIVEKYGSILASSEDFNPSMETAKACAIEEVKAVIKALDEANAYDLLPSIEYHEKVLTEIEKL